MQNFSTQNEEPDGSVAVTFEQAAIQPPAGAVVSCALFAGKDGQYVMARHPSGWDMPSLIKNNDEEPEGCVYRLAEAMGIDITEPQFIGQWVISKTFESPLNQALPQTSYQLLFIADVTHAGEFTPTPQLAERQLVGDHDMKSLHHDFDNFRDIFDYARSRFNRIP
jgi:hypothetical protein